MSTHTQTVEEHELHAYVDGQLDPQRREVVEAWLADHPEAAQKVAEYQRQNQAMREMFNPVMEEPVPDTITVPSRRNGINHSEINARPLLRVAAMAGFMFIGGIIGYAVHGQAPVIPPSQMANFSQQAVIAHVVYTPEVLHPVEVSAEQEAHLSKWLSKRLGTKLNVPHLAPMGFNLVGGRLLPGEKGPAAQFMYENTQGKRLTLYVSHVDKKVSETAFRYNKKDGVSVFYWIDGSLGYALTGEIAKQQLLDAANEVYHALNL